jgi:hypothetical protein
MVMRTIRKISACGETAMGLSKSELNWARPEASSSNELGAQHCPASKYIVVGRRALEFIKPLQHSRFA